MTDALNVVSHSGGSILTVVVLVFLVVSQRYMQMDINELKSDVKKLLGRRE